MFRQTEFTLTNHALPADVQLAGRRDARFELPIWPDIAVYSRFDRRLTVMAILAVSSKGFEYGGQFFLHRKE
jgi:hypothetical protein